MPRGPGAHTRLLCPRRKEVVELKIGASMVRVCVRAVRSLDFMPYEARVA